MLFPLVILLLLYWIIAKNKQFKENVFILTIILSIFFFSSSIPIINLPLYFLTMCISLIANLFNIRKKVSKKLITVFLLINCFLLLQIFNIILSVNVFNSLLINKSNTDILNLLTEMHTPVFDFTIIKHYIFYVLYLLFLIFNVDIIKTKMNKTVKITEITFRVLFICIIVEFIFVNVFDGFNDRQIMAFIFNYEPNQLENWLTFGVYSVALCFNERSSMAIILFYVLIRLNKLKYGNNKAFIWDALSLLAAFCTGSTTAIFIIGVYIIIVFFHLLFSRPLTPNTAIFLIAIVVFSMVILSNYSVYLDKILVFIYDSNEYGSASFRRNSINIAIDCIIKNPLIGLGIGTNYSHSALFQTLANIGFIGAILFIKIHKMIIPKNKVINFTLVIRVVFTLIVLSAAFMLQQITSPFSLMLIYLTFDYDNNNYVVFAG